jgi:hypothetical protein
LREAIRGVSLGPYTRPTALDSSRTLRLGLRATCVGRGAAYSA